MRLHLRIGRPAYMFEALSSKVGDSSSNLLRGSSWRSAQGGLARGGGGVSDERCARKGTATGGFQRARARQPVLLAVSMCRRVGGRSPAAAEVSWRMDGPVSGVFPDDLFSNKTRYYKWYSLLRGFTTAVRLLTE